MAQDNLGIEKEATRYSGNSRGWLLMYYSGRSYLQVYFLSNWMVEYISTFNI